MIDESRKWTFYKVAGFAFPSRTIFIFIWLSSLHLSDPTACFNSLVSSLLDCKFFLNSIFGLVGGALQDMLHLVQWVDNSDSLTVVSMGLMLMIAIAVLMNLCAAGIALGFGEAGDWLCWNGLGLAFLAPFAFHLLIEVLHLDLVLLPSDPITSLTTSGSIFMLTDCKSILILLGRVLNLDSVQVQWVENANSFTNVSLGLTQILVLKNL